MQNNFSARRLHLPFPWRQRVRCWDGHNTPDEMHRSSGEGRRDHDSGAWRWCRGSREARAQSMAAGWGRSHSVSMPGLPTGSGLSPSRTDKGSPGPFALGGLSQGGGVRVGFLTTSLEVAPDATPPVINNSQEKKEQSRGDRNERWAIARRFTSPMLLSGPEKPLKESTNPARLTYGKPTGKPGAEEAGGTLSEPGLRVTERRHLGLRQRTQPALVMQQPGLAGLGSGLPLSPAPAGPQAAEAVCDRQRTAGQREGQGRGDGSGHPTGISPRPLGTGCRQDSLGLH